MIDHGLRELFEHLDRDPGDRRAWRALVAAEARTGRLAHGIQRVRSLAARAAAGGDGEADAAFLELAAEAGFGLGDPWLQFEGGIARLAQAPATGRLAVAAPGWGLEVFEPVAGPRGPRLVRAAGAAPTAFVDLLAFAADGDLLLGAGFPEPELKDPDPRLRLLRWRPGAHGVTEQRLDLVVPPGARPEFRVKGVSADLRRLICMGSLDWLGVVDLDPGAPEPLRRVRRFPIPRPAGFWQRAWVSPAGACAVLGGTRTPPPGDSSRWEYLVVRLDSGEHQALRQPDGAEAAWAFEPGERVRGWWEDPYDNPSEFSSRGPKQLFLRYDPGTGRATAPESVFDPPPGALVDRASRPGHPSGDGEPEEIGTYARRLGLPPPAGPAALGAVELGAGARTLRVGLGVTGATPAAGALAALHDAPIERIEVPAAGGRVLTASAAEVVAWAWPAGTRLGRVELAGRSLGGGAADLHALATDAAGRWLVLLHASDQPAGTSRSGGLRLVAHGLGPEGEVELLFPALASYWFRRLALAPDGKSLVVGMWHGDVRVFPLPIPVAEWKPGLRLELRQTVQWKGHDSWITTVGFVPGRAGEVFSDAAGAPDLCVHRDSDGTRLRKWNRLRTTPPSVPLVRPHPARGLLGLGTHGAVAYLPDSGEGHPLGPRRTDVRAVALSDDGARLALALADGAVEVHALAPDGGEAGRLDHFLPGMGMPRALAFEPGGPRLLYAQEQHLRLRDGPG